ncbi:hypothetical protein IWW37_003925 [Coemansia sp. RSA 2050]|nr:hypothetical protein IWW37_003925 [Coemansia sp. RSA 2050]
MDTDEWLQILAQHPIFDEQSLLLGNSGSSGPNEFKSKRALARERAVVRGTDLFVAVGSEVRWINLKACKDAYVRYESKRMGLKSEFDKARSPTRHATSKQDAVKSVPWFKLECEALTFDVVKLACNSTGKLLVAMGLHQVAIVVLPAPGASGKAVGTASGGAFNLARHEAPEEDANHGVWVDCRSMLVGATQGASSGSAMSKKDSRRRSSVGAPSAANWSVRARVADVAWHPLSTNSSHLLVLNANGTVKMFDVTEDVDFPEQTVSLFGVSSTGAGYSMSQAVSLCFGSPKSVSWSRVTVYVLANTGDLYGLCPMLPRQCCLEREWLSSLLETAEIGVRELQAEEFTFSDRIYTPYEVADARAVAKWLSQILEQGQHKGSETSGERMFLTLPAHLSQPPIAQGPYLFKPEPVSMSTPGYDSDSGDEADGGSCRCDPDDACDVLYIESTGGVGLVAISFCDGHVEIFADLMPIIGRWSGVERRKTVHDLPLLVTLASVDLTVQPLTDDNSWDLSSRDKRAGSVTLLADTMSPTVLYALHSYGVHRVDMSKWAGLLSKAVGLASDEGREEALDQLLFALDGRPQSTTMAGNGRGALARNCVKCIVHTNPCASQPAIPVVGAVVIEDTYLSYSLLALVAPCQLIGVSLPLFSDPADYDSDEADEAGDRTNGDGVGASNDGDDSGHLSQPRRIDLSLGAKDVVYVPRLPRGGYEVPAILNSGWAAAEQQPRFVLGAAAGGGEAEEYTEEKLRLLGEVVGRLREQLAAMVSAHSDMRTHLDLQVQEYRRQHEKLTAIANGFSRHFEQMKVAQQRLESMNENGRRLALRVDHLLRQLISYHQLELTPSERELAREVREISDRVGGNDGFRQRIHVLEEQTNAMKTVDNPATHVLKLSPAEIENIKQAINLEAIDIQKALDKVADLGERLDGLGIEDNNDNAQ